MSLLVMLQDAADIIGLPRPGAIVSSTDTQIRQLLSLANREGKALAKRTSWQALTTEATHTTVAAEEQGTVEAIMPGFAYLMNETPWNRSQQERVGGPLSAVEWQLLQASNTTGPYQDFRIRDGKLYLFPAPPAGETVALEYVSRHWCESAASVGQERWAMDDDTGILSEDLMVLGVVWRWRQQKGMDYGEDFITYEREVGDAMARDGARRVLTMEESVHEYAPTIRAPIGSWSP